MKKLSQLLKISVIALTLVLCVYAAASGGRKAADQAAFVPPAQSRPLQEEIANIGEVLSTVSPPVQSDGGYEKKNQDVRADYTPPQMSGELVEPINALGDAPVENYDFPDRLYPYRAMLTPDQQKVYGQIYESANALKAEVTLCTPLSASGIQNVMTTVFNDHPELFWLDTSYAYGYTAKGTVVSVTLKFNETAENLQTSRKRFLDTASTIINGAAVLESTLEKEKYVYKALQNGCVYDENAALNQSAYSALVLGSSVCAGYSRAFQYIMLQLDIPCYFCSGYANGGYHAWNMIQIDGQYYNVDLSWDDSLGDMTNTISYTYFNLSDKAISADHTRRDLSVNLPRTGAA